ncbi:hypothetical protein [Streptomyces sp. L2]|uniref:hypothetical protein n=1 Tax=Streptomyces sp. L2 TaxID=2162665 RepID=UPI0013E97FF0|nr:hypothetical protein [Streptomyces sp. L2]
MTPSPTGIDRLPVYESLIRELGDAVAEARVVAEQTQHHMTLALTWPGPPHPEPRFDHA